MPSFDCNIKKILDGFSVNIYVTSLNILIGKPSLIKRMYVSIILLNHSLITQCNTNTVLNDYCDVIRV